MCPETLRVYQYLLQLLQLAAHGWAREAEALCACLGHVASLLPLPATPQIATWALEAREQADAQHVGFLADSQEEGYFPGPRDGAMQHVQRCVDSPAFLKRVLCCCTAWQWEGGKGAGCAAASVCR